MKFVLASMLLFCFQGMTEATVNKRADIPNVIPLVHTEEYQEFKSTLGYFESRGDYSVVNSWGFKGKYQFSDYMIGKFAKVPPNVFLASPAIQEQAMTAVIRHYISYVKRAGYTRFIGRYIGGTKITMATLLVGCHFSPSYLHRWLHSNGRENSDDGYISIGAYLSRFNQVYNDNCSDRMIEGKNQSFAV